MTAQAMALRLLSPLLETEQTRTFFRGATATLALRGVSMLLRMLTGILMARMLGASNYGMYAYAMTWAALLALPGAAGLDQVVLRYVSVYRETRDWPALRGLLQFAVWLALCVGVAVAAGGVLWVAGTTGDSLFRQTMIITLLGLPIMVLSKLEQSALRAFDRPVIAQGPENIVYPAAMVLLTFLAYAWFSGEVTAVHGAAASVTAWALATALATAFRRGTVPSEVRASEPAYRHREWMTMMPPLIVAALAYHGVSRGEVLILGMLRPSADVGIYTVASRGAELMLFMYEAISIVGASVFASLYARGDLPELQRFTTLATRVILCASLPVLIVLFTAAPWFLSLFGQEFSEGVTVMRILAITFFLSSLSGFIIVMLYMTGHQTPVAVTMGIMALGNLALARVLIPLWGMTGAAIASGATLVMLHGILVVVLYRRVGILSLPFAPRHLSPARA